LQTIKGGISLILNESCSGIFLKIVKVLP